MNSNEVIKLFLGILIAMLIFGLLSNSIIFCVFRRRKFDKVMARNYFCLLSITETLSLITMIPYRLSLSYNIMTFSRVSCQLVTFFLFYFPMVSTWLLVMINIERFIAIKYSTNLIFGKINFQIKIFVGMFMWNFIFHLFMLHSID